jgi:hypothetical protein
VKAGRNVWMDRLIRRSVSCRPQKLYKLTDLRDSVMMLEQFRVREEYGSQGS